MNGWARISVVILAKEAEALLPAALASLPREAEVIVADDGSRDRTADLARASGARVVPQDRARIARSGGNFDVARNTASEAAARAWILFLDADERISPALADELAAWTPPPDLNGYAIGRINLYWGKPVRLLGPDHQMRLFRRGSGRYPPGGLHQPLQVDGATSRLAAPLLHENIRSWADIPRRFRRDLPIEAAHVDHRPSRREIAAALVRYFRFYCFQQGAWRDGWRGVVVPAIYAAYHAGILRAARKTRHA